MVPEEAAMKDNVAPLLDKLAPCGALPDLERLINDLENTGKVQRGEKVQ